MAKRYYSISIAKQSNQTGISHVISTWNELCSL